MASAGIYGANASGKSNVVLALKALFWLVNESHNFKEGDRIPAYQPFRLSQAQKRAAVEFAIEFILHEVRYLYQITFDGNSIISERLGFYSVGEKRTVFSKLFERAPNVNWGEITFGGFYKGGSKKIPLFKNQAYLSKAGNTPDAPEIIRSIYQFFSHGIRFIDKANYPIDPSWKKDNTTVKAVSDFLTEVDTGISRLLIKYEEPKDFNRKFPSGIPEQIRSTILEDVAHVPYFEHMTADGSLEEFTEEDESAGTRALVNSLPLIFKVLVQGEILVWDELEVSLHPHIAELLLDLFNNPKVNKNDAQLLFTTHNLSLMNSAKMRKDQLWLTEKKSGSTYLISMEEFDGSQLKATSPFAKWYDEGRLAGLPIININGINQLFAGLRATGGNGGEKTQSQ